MRFWFSIFLTFFSALAFSGCGDSAHQKPAVLPSKDEWMRRVAPYNPANSPVQVISESDFKKLFGEPTQVQQLDLTVYWNYECSDGMVQVVLADPKQSGGILAINSINLY